MRPGSRRHDEHPIRARERPARSGPQRDHERAAAAGGNVAYRLLGSLADAEDVVQETYARWYALSRAQQEAIETPGAWLTTVASRICLDQLRSARARRERYVGQWIPEPLPERGVSGQPGGGRPTPPTASPSTSRSGWRSWSCSSR